MEAFNERVWYEALCSRDPRFDGVFFVGVTTTGIYCRSICPARKPLRKNVRFYHTAAAAEAAGFRSCRRCRPETAPGTPAWMGTEATVSRALKLLSQDESLRIASLACRLGISDRRLRQLFAEHLGTSPRALVQAKRIVCAKQLIEITTLPLTEIAFCAGFASIRRFNDALKKHLGCTPSEHRTRVQARTTLQSLSSSGDPHA